MPNFAIGLFKTASRQLFLKSKCDVIDMSSINMLFNSYVYEKKEK